jgi:hypothetical protein
MLLCKCVAKQSTTVAKLGACENKKIKKPLYGGALQ